ncbi:hypothetical protein [Pseudorhodoplanes sinuspersici]|uniref:Uncharacterized protein n=1 Tax=Pseudorhodoplanes sinuspersici TaxID=1235591 RepID=A0A1W6ZSP5_9HYPH|nr:hypothetical protein [Pseudorhodoplanes sinuspersici]ARQ00131.1 hypothetical protein CAK95_14355 [Pseudorhodoplanes sinuspersici]RKE65650.1 hypothetical protein DFP91_5867 [Pseudorhodoplanes sinuspersici]
MEGVILIVAYATIAITGLAIAVSIGLLTDQINAHVGMLVFFVAAAAAMVAAWPLALRLTKPVDEATAKALLAGSRTA